MARHTMLMAALLVSCGAPDDKALYAGVAERIAARMSPWTVATPPRAA